MFRISLFIQTRRDCTIFWISVLIQTRRVLLYSGYSFLFRPRGFYYILDMCSYPDQGDSIIFRISILIQTRGSTIFQIFVFIQTRGFYYILDISSCSDQGVHVSFHRSKKVLQVRFLLIKMYFLKEFLHSDLKRCL